VSNLVRAASCTVGAAVLPSSTGVTLRLVSEAELDELARQHDARAIMYVAADSVRFGEGEAEIRLGVAIRLAPGEARAVTCCCGGEMVLRRVSGKWAFERWRNVYCA